MGTLLLLIFIALWLFVVYREHQDDKKRIAKDKCIQETITHNNLPRGTTSERDIIATLIKEGYSEYLIYHDLYVPIENNEYTQVDIVILTEVGIVVVEDKDYSGWIFGNGYQPEWTQILAYGNEKNRFYNPVWQNHGHIKAMKQCLAGIVDVPFFSVITFSPKCSLRNISNIPSDTYVCYSDDLMSTIEKIIETNSPASYGDNDNFTILLSSYEANGGNPRIVQLHKEAIKLKKYGKNQDSYKEFYDSI